MLQDTIASLKAVAAKQRRDLEKVKEDYSGAMWIISQKDTEIRLITKEKDNIQEKFLETRLDLLA